jgi:hypothetical protein
MAQICEQRIDSPIVSLVSNNLDQDTRIPQIHNHQSEPHREPLKHLLTGSSKAVTSTIQHLQKLGYAQVGDWSPLVPSPTNPGEVMSILVRPIMLP